MKGARLIVACWLIAVAMLTYAHLQDEQGFPPAFVYGGAATVYSLLVGLSAIPGASGLAGTFAVGWTIALYFRLTGGALRRPPGKQAPTTSPTPAKEAKAA